MLHKIYREFYVVFKKINNIWGVILKNVRLETFNSSNGILQLWKINKLRGEGHYFLSSLYNAQFKFFSELTLATEEKIYISILDKPEFLCNYVKNRVL